MVGFIFYGGMLDLSQHSDSDATASLFKFAELTLKRASLSANEQDEERYRYLKENYVMVNFNIYDDEDFSNGQTGLIIEVPNEIYINRDLDLVVDQAITNNKTGE